MISAEQVKTQSEQYLERRGVAINPALPLIELPQAAMASGRDVRLRCLALSGVCAVAYGAPREAVRSWTTEHGIDGVLSDTERSFLQLPNTTETEVRLQPEAIWELAWVAELIPAVDHFTGCSDELVHMVPKVGEDPSAFLADARIRDNAAIWSEADFLYRLHWAVRDASLQGRPTPTRLPEYVSRNRLRAINWVLGPSVGWDQVDVST